MSHQYNLLSPTEGVLETLDYSDKVGRGGMGRGREGVRERERGKEKEAGNVGRVEMWLYKNKGNEGLED